MSESRIKVIINYLRGQRQDLKFHEELWKTENCYRCGKPYDKNSYWCEFAEINGVMWRVPICDECAGVSVKMSPTEYFKNHPDELLKGGKNEN
jgi:NAD-dependent SIR2 family protein deacetylase